MANFNWIGGATAQTQVDTGTIGGTWSASETITTTVQDEGGTSYTVVSTATGSDIETQVRDIHLLDLQNDTQTVFTNITWAASGTTAITATNKVTGRPNSGGSLTNLVVGSETAASGTFTYASTTANAGPNDANTDANWTDENGNTTTSPLANGVVKFLPHPTDTDFAGNQLSYDLKYGLNQSAIDLNELRIGKSYRGVIGDPINQFYLQIDCQAAADSITSIDSSSPSIWLKGTHDQINVAGLPVGNDALHLHGGTVTVLRLLGPRVLGKVTIADSNDFQQIESLGANMEVEIGTQTTATSQIDRFMADGGNWVIKRGLHTDSSNDAEIIITGGVFRLTAGAVDLLDVRGGQFYHNSSGTITRLYNYGGVTNFEENTTHGFTVTNATIWNGVIQDKSGLRNVTYTNDVVVYGGFVTSDTATTQSTASA